MTHKSKVDRSGKGDSVIASFDTYVSFDIETTGFSPITNEIIEIGAVLVSNGMIVDEFHTLVQPTQPVPFDITLITGITNEMLSDAPRLDDILCDFLAFIGDYPLVGHNVGFDVNFVYDGATRCLGHGIDNIHVNTIRLAKPAAPDLPNYKLGTVLKYFGIENESAHRALSDAKATYQLYEKLKQCTWGGTVLPYSAAFGGYTYENVFESIKYIVDDTEPNVELKINKNYASIYMFGSVAFEIHINSRSRYIDTDNASAEEYVNLVPNAYVSAVGGYRFPIASAPENVCAIEDMIRAVYDAHAALMRGEPFGCCNDFERCSDALECLHKLDPDYSGCYYRKNLEAGRIFYGKNKTI